MNSTTNKIDDAIRDGVTNVHNVTHSSVRDKIRVSISDDICIKINRNVFSFVYGTLRRKINE